MAKQQAVLKLSMEDSKKRAKAMKCVVGIHGVTSASQEGDKITVIGEGIDSVALTSMLRRKMGSMLRRKMGHVELLALTAVEDKKEEKAAEVKVEDAKSVHPIVWPTYYGGATVAPPPYSYYMHVGERGYNYDNPCSIM